ncbi:MAG: Vitamin B12 ABC transporter, B12-binding component BtuF [Ignavibacteriae bacterium]|nr:MAG: Vitamin B12 ABC transporter, B12-binding component BtuF [Ignavibacteriota bacterium]
MSRSYHLVKLFLFVTALFLTSACERRLPHPKTTLPLAIIDDIGNRFLFEEEPKRIISLAPSITEILFALDSGKSLVGVTDFCDYPPEAKLKPSVGGMINPNLEKIAELNPEVIIMTFQGNDKWDYYQLKGMGYKVFVLNPKMIDGIFLSINHLSRLTGAITRGSLINNELRKKYKEIVEQEKFCKRQKVGVVVNLEPLMFAGLDTFIDEMIIALGCENPFSYSYMQYPIVSREDVVKKDPDVIVVLDDVVKNLEELYYKYPEWKTLKAYRNNKIVIVDADLLSRPGPRILQGFEILANILNKQKQLTNNKEIKNDK